MNKVEATEQEPPQAPLTPGSIWMENRQKQFYSLQKLGDQYLLACLDDGEPYGELESADDIRALLGRFTRIHGTVTITPQP